MMAYKKFKKYAALVLVVLGFISCKERGFLEQVYVGSALGTSYQVKLFSNKELEIDKGLDSIFTVINNSMSTYQEDSDISRINKGDTTVVIDDNFKEVFIASRKIYDESKGYFDPTVGSLVNAYGFGPDHTKDSLNAVEIDSMLQYVGLNKLTLTSQNRIKKQAPEIYLDFNAIAKGYTIDVIAKYLDKNKIDNYLIELGGELVAKGENIGNQQAWIVAIDDPLQEEGSRTFQATLKLENRAMATSGNYRKFRIEPKSGQRFVHTISPITGRSQKSNLLSASVLAKNCALADGYATAFMAMGMEKSLEMLKDLKDVDVYFIYSEGSDDVKIYTSDGFQKVLVE
ncbi:FAD:protein FMN transferase [Gillisia sp. M10.2A]|uniref:FAD:protein FMN transferase n=1 Tax=Gillisia lutea TaxID=2909668 RepID=A0ABS9EKR7_9FLAO|nr:FAD:protein FMN transferase [Gillisia lutea]MCF4102390.1 FAD:protein FMN transferase [Gillisia lutea]